MKTHTKTLLATLTASAMIAGTANATVYLWISSNPAGAGQNNNLNDVDNWSYIGGLDGGDPATPSASNDQLDTNSADDEIIFDASLGGNLQPRNIYTRTNTNWGVIRVNDGDILWRNDGNSQGNYSYSDAASGTPTLVVGDGIGAADSAIARFNIQNWNAGNGDKTYVINSDGQLLSARSVADWSNGGNDTVMRIIGGEVNITASLAENDLLSDANDYVVFEALGSEFTFGKGGAGSFDEASDVTSGFGDAFRLGGSLNAGNAALELTDNGGSWTITAIVPEPSSLALLGLGGLLIGARRRRG